MSYCSEGYKNIDRKVGIMAKKIAKTAQESGMRKFANHMQQTSGAGNRIRTILGMKPKIRPEKSNPESIKKEKKATLRAAKMVAVLQSHKPGTAQDQEAINRDRGAKKYAKSNIVPLKRDKTRKEQYIFDLIEREYGWREKLPSGNTPSQKTNTKLSKLSASTMSNLKKGTPPSSDTLRRLKKLKQTTAAQNTLTPASERKGPSSRGGNAQKPKDTNSSWGSLPNIPAAGGEGESTSVGGRYGSRGKGTSGGSGGTIRNKAVSYSGVRHFGVKNEEIISRFRSRLNEYKFPLSKADKDRVSRARKNREDYYNTEINPKSEKQILGQKPKSQETPKRKKLEFEVK